KIGSEELSRKTGSALERVGSQGMESVRLYEAALKESDNLDALSWIHRLASLEAENECLKKAQPGNVQQAKSTEACNSCLMERDKYVQANKRITELEVRVRIAESAARQGRYDDTAAALRDIASLDVAKSTHIAPRYSEMRTNLCQRRPSVQNHSPANETIKSLSSARVRTASLELPLAHRESFYFSILSSIKNCHPSGLAGEKRSGVSPFLRNPIFMEWIQGILVPDISASSLCSRKFAEGCAGALCGPVDFEYARSQLSDIPSLHDSQCIISDFINLHYLQVITTDETLLAKYALKTSVAKAILSIHCSDGGNFHAAERVFASLERQFDCYDSHVCKLLHARELQGTDRLPSREAEESVSSASRKQFVDFIMGQVPSLRSAHNLVRETAHACAYPVQQTKSDGAYDATSGDVTTSPATRRAAWTECMLFLKFSEFVNRLLQLCESEDERTQVFYAVGVLRAAEAEAAVKQ
ncbi:hypothetical protein HDU82_003474, partial [Entophlyctis luteolus]